MELFAWHNGSSANAVALANRGFAYGDGLFETIKVCGGRPQFLAEHWRRLRRDCARLQLSVDFSVLQFETERALRTRRDGILKIMITRGAGARGYASTPSIGAERWLLFYPQQFDRDAREREGVAARICRQRLAEQPTLAGIKHLNRLEQVIARAEWSDSAIAEGLMLDNVGRLIEGTMSNLFLVRDNKVYTPRLHRCGVAGVMREIILYKLAPRCVSVIETDLLLDDLYSADEVFISNSIIGILPVRKIECLHKPVGAVTIAFQHALTQLLTEKNVLAEENS
jgi:4-amino-4-deoxychorismate lyase